LQGFKGKPDGAAHFLSYEVNGLFWDPCALNSSRGNSPIDSNHEKESYRCTHILERICLKILPGVDRTVAGWGAIPEWMNAWQLRAEVAELNVDSINSFKGVT